MVVWPEGPPMKKPLISLIRLLVTPLLILLFGVFPTDVRPESLIVKDPNGFAGIQWGESLLPREDLVLIEPDERIHTFQFRDSPPNLASISVESLKLLSIDGQFARVMIHYQGERIHTQIMNYLETRFGKINLNPGSMMRGLNQGYLWRGSNTEISLNYRGFGERGFIMFQSRILAPRFLDSLSEHSH